MSTSGIYELIEWAGTEVLPSSVGRTFLAAPNDFWDAQKDMVLALGGAILAMLITFLVQR